MRPDIPALNVIPLSTLNYVSNEWRLWLDRHGQCVDKDYFVTKRTFPTYEFRVNIEILDPEIATIFKLRFGA